MKMKWMVLVSAACFLPVTNAQSLPGDDARLDWHCVYPYTETNCQAIMLAWSRDNDVPPERLIDGHQCSGCESYYFTDPFANQHLLYAKCVDRFGARFTQGNLLAPINRYKESIGDSVGWNIVEWRFERCFETWECGEFCSLQTLPPTCLKYQTSNWGLYVPVLEGACSYGTGVLNTLVADETSPPPSTTPPATTVRDTTWQPVY